ncbi:MULTISPECIES: hypothetical protein [unclassified Micromonospora]|uniref:hypothetical protein n=1 Tax=unclassified Micromonospora TaxID=2617518 RepID=UPI0033E2FFFE
MTDTTAPVIEDVPLPGMPDADDLSSPADPAAFPERLEDVNADSLTRWLVCHATERGALNFTGLSVQNPAAFAHSSCALNAEWALAYVLRELPPSLGDRLAKQIWSTWDEGSGPYELPAEWMTEYGMNPDALIERVQRNRREAA